MARGLHKQNGCQVAVHSLPADERFCEDNILLPVLSRAKVFKTHGMSRVLCGVDADGEPHDDSTTKRISRPTCARWTRAGTVEAATRNHSRARSAVARHQPSLTWLGDPLRQGVPFYVLRS